MCMAIDSSKMKFHLINEGETYITALTDSYPLL